MSLSTEQHIAHCKSQIMRFSQMLMDWNTIDRSRDECLAQLAFNLGRYTELAEPANGRALWQELSYCIDVKNYSTLIERIR